MAAPPTSAPLARPPSRTSGEPSWPHGARELAVVLAWLRLCAVLGQALTVTIVSRVLGLAIPVAALAAGIAALALFAAFAFWRLRRPAPVSSAEVVGHIAVDTAVLAYLLYLTGGATNPFVTLLVMPITLAAAALPLAYVAALAVLAAASYLALMRWHVALPSLHSATALGDFDVHVAGMAINFVITASMLGFFIARLAHALRARESAIRRERERALRDEGILAIAVQAAGAAHELNTPLSTMRTLLAELRREKVGDAALGEDLALLAGEADRCRDILRELVAVGSAQLAGTRERTDVATFVDGCVDRFHLLRPEVDAALRVEPACAALAIAVEPALRHALINLLSNAADASLAQAGGHGTIVLDVIRDGDAIAFAVRDRGPGLRDASDAATRFRSSKRDGLGLGLALARSTAERLGGTLATEAPPDGGTIQRLRIPLAALDNRAP